MDSYRPMFPPPAQRGGGGGDRDRDRDRRHQNSDSYRPEDSYRAQNLYRTDRHTPRYGYNDRDRPPARDDFSFRPPSDAPRFPPVQQQQAIPQGPRRNNQHGGSRGGSFRGFGRGRPQAAHDRALLKNNTLSRDEQFLGISDGPKFNALEDSSDLDDDLGGNAAADEELNEEQPNKKTRANNDVANGDSVPKWSNPDPYTSLPPPDDSQRKGIDFVQLIRKAKVEQEKAQSAANAVSQNDDFISFNLDEEGRKSDAGNKSDVAGKRDEPLVGSLNDFPSMSGPHSEVTAASLQLMAQKRQWANIDYGPEPAYQASKSKKRKRAADIGKIEEEWLPKTGRPPTPWCQVDHSKTKTMGLWLHKEICDFYEFVRPHDFEDEIRSELVARISQVLSAQYKDFKVHSFGSFHAGLYLPTADMDLVLISTSYYRNGPAIYGRSNNELYRVRNLLERRKIARPGVEVITGAKVPLVKFVDALTGLKVDLSFENMTGLYANDTFKAWKMQYPAMPKLVTLIKHFLLMRNLNEVFSGGLGGFSVTCLVTYYLSTLPAAQSGNMNTDHHLGQMLVDFFDYFGNQFNMNKVLLRMDPPRSETKGVYGPNQKLLRADRLYIVDPNNPKNDISGGSNQVELIFRLFSDAAASLKSRMHELNARSIPDRKDSSILECIFAGDYSSFHWQRQKLRRVFDEYRNKPNTRDRGRSNRDHDMDHDADMSGQGFAHLPGTSNDASNIGTAPGTAPSSSSQHKGNSHHNVNSRNATTENETSFTAGASTGAASARWWSSIVPAETNVPGRALAMEFSKRFPNYPNPPTTLTVEESRSHEFRARFPDFPFAIAEWLSKANFEALVLEAMSRQDLPSNTGSHPTEHHQPGSSDHQFQSYRPTPSVGYVYFGGASTAARGTKKNSFPITGYDNVNERLTEQKSILETMRERIKAIPGISIAERRENVAHGDRGKEKLRLEKLSNEERFRELYPGAPVPDNLNMESMRAVEFKARYPNLTPAPDDLPYNELSSLEFEAQNPSVQVPRKMKTNDIKAVQQRSLDNDLGRASDIKSRYANVFEYIPDRMSKKEHETWQNEGNARKVKAWTHSRVSNHVESAFSHG